MRWAAVALLLTVSCIGRQEPLGPDPSDFKGLPEWSPCVGVHTPGGAPFVAQIGVLRELRRLERVSWVRMDVFADGRGVEYHNELSRMGIRIINIVSIRDLAVLGGEGVLDRVTSLYPGDIWQIGNEIQSTAVNHGVSLSASRYMEIFTPLVAYARNRGFVLASASPEGLSGPRGPDTLRQFIRMGLLNLDVVIAMNIYTDKARNEYGSILHDAYRLGLISGQMIIVTETGVSRSKDQVGYVQKFYPAIDRLIDPDLICWYTLYAGDGNKAGLMSGIFDPPIRHSPLLSLLLMDFRAI